MFQAVGDLVTLKWVREHPLVTGSVALAAAAIQYAVQGEEGVGQGQTQLTRPDTTGKRRHGISWEDEHGGKLATVLSDRCQEIPEEDDSASQKGLRRDRLEPKILKSRLDGKSNSSSSRSSSNNLCDQLQSSLDDFDSDISDDNNKTGVASTESPQWGWFVTFTPPHQPKYKVAPPPSKDK